MKKLLEGLINLFFQPCKDKHSVPPPTLEDYAFYYGMITVMLLVVYGLYHIFK